MKRILLSLVTPLSILSYWGIYFLGLYGNLDMWIVMIIISIVSIVEITTLQVLAMLSMK